MPPKSRTPQEVQQVRERIIEEAATIMQKQGVDGLSMRSLSSNLNMSATNLYNYFHNKHEIYLHTMIAGFRIMRQLQDDLLEHAIAPADRVKSWLEGMIAFGERYPAYYQLMFSTTDPKAMDFASTPFEALAREEKEIAMGAFHSLSKVVGACLPAHSEDEISMISVRILCEVHGVVNLYHTSILRELNATYGVIASLIVARIIKELSSERV